MRAIAAKKHLEGCLKRLREETEKLILIDEDEDDYRNSIIDRHVIHNWTELCSVLYELISYGFLRENALSILENDESFLYYVSGIKPSFQSDLEISASSFYRFSRKIKSLESMVAHSVDILSEFIEDDEDNQINIKLPDNVSVAELHDIIRDLDYIFSSQCQVIYEANDKKPVTLRKVDSGSNWIMFALATSFAINIVGSLVTLAYGISEKKIELSKSLHNLRVIEGLSSTIETMEKGLDETIKTWIDAELEVFAKGNDIELKEDDHAKRDGLYTSIRKLMSLRDANVEIYASLSAPKDVTSLFPAYKEPLKIKGEIGKLTTKSEVTINEEETQ